MYYFIDPAGLYREEEALPLDVTEVPQRESIFCVFNKSTHEWNLSLSLVRATRDKLLSDCDYKMLPDYPITLEERAEWETYRQALRDLPDVCAESLSACVLPVKPTSVPL